MNQFFIVQSQNLIGYMLHFDHALYTSRKPSAETQSPHRFRPSKTGTPAFLIQAAP
jgi:hypothetical protein